ncbi:hypothetical protein K458DRAFT_389989 [Lentithecium fluviatile CBS 122367]|uniref:Nephrocystin 3-like N-terminal domain-containing protein n=1 Tax=Lentithecium fluviatile CBS 122367 TaxID=1168545 RepID=A0A6G1IYP6_9PLEO|nr:hypothetical protein K458DRAFT_389989 [Lentithecium fluviatile CBS 122367]
MQEAFACCAVQVAESNPHYAEHVAAKLREDAVKPRDFPTWTRFFTSVFTSTAKSMDRLYLVFDGLDEIEDAEKELLVDFLKEVREEKAAISVLVTSRPEESPAIERLEPSIIDITRERISADLKALVKHRIGTLPRLKKFRPMSKKAVIRKVARHADCMLYVEHMLRGLSDLGREDMVFRALETMPASLTDLYKLLLDECGHDRSDDQFQILKTLFAWLAFSDKAPELKDGWQVVEPALPDSETTLDLEGEIIGRSSRILELSQSNLANEDLFEDAEDVTDQDSVDGASSLAEDYVPGEPIAFSLLTF